LEHNAKPSVKNNAKKLFCLLLALLYYFCTKKASKVYLFYKPNAVSLVFFLCLIFYIMNPCSNYCCGQFWRHTTITSSQGIFLLNESRTCCYGSFFLCKTVPNLKAGEYNIQSPLVGGGKVNYVVSVRNLGMKYHSLNGEIDALQNINFSVSEGEFISIVGPSGCGKSTLLSLIAGLMAPTTGEILVDGKPVSETSDKVDICCKRPSF